MKITIGLFLVLLMLPTISIAGPLEDGKAAYARSDWQTAQKLLQPLADDGNAEAENIIGEIYSRHEGLVSDEEALELFRDAAEQGLAAAQLNLAKSYDAGSGVKRDRVQAFKWYRKAANQGFAPAQTELGQMYEVNQLGKRKSVVKKDDLEALKWYHKAADQGYAPAQVAIGQLYEQNNWRVKQPRVIKPDNAEALKWYRKAADQGDRGGQLAIVNMNFLGEASGRQDWVEYTFWSSLASNSDETYSGADTISPWEASDIRRRLRAWRPSPAPATVITGQFENGRAAYDNKDYQKALKLLRPLAEQGNAAAQLYIGEMYRESFGANWKNIPQGGELALANAEAMKWFRMAAQQGFVPAQLQIGWMYERDNGDKMHTAEALKWYHKAADQGNPDAQVRVGMLHLLRPVKQDDEQPVKWFHMAADRGDPGGMYALARIYGPNGTIHDNEEGFFWYCLAVKATQLHDIPFQFETYGGQWNLTPKQIAVVKERVLKWKPSQ